MDNINTLDPNPRHMTILLAWIEAQWNMCTDRLSKDKIMNRLSDKQTRGQMEKGSDWLNDERPEMYV